MVQPSGIIQTLGSTALISDDSGEIVQDTGYYPFGETRTNAGTASNINYLFTGQEFDPETGLYNYNARLYDPKIGRFISADTIIPNPYNGQSFNRYSYVLNNPIRYTDPTGHREVGLSTDGDPDQKYEWEGPPGGSGGGGTTGGDDGTTGGDTTSSKPGKGLPKGDHIPEDLGEGAGSENGEDDDSDITGGFNADDYAASMAKWWSNYLEEQRQKWIQDVGVPMAIETATEKSKADYKARMAEYASRRPGVSTSGRGTIAGIMTAFGSGLSMSGDKSTRIIGGGIGLVGLGIQLSQLLMNGSEPGRDTGLAVLGVVGIIIPPIGIAAGIVSIFPEPPNTRKPFNPNYNMRDMFSADPKHKSEVIINFMNNIFLY